MSPSAARRTAVVCALASAAALSIAPLAGVPVLGAKEKGAQPSPAKGSPPEAQVRAASDPAARLLAAGWNELDLVDYRKAQKTFEQAPASHPAPAQKAEAMFALAHLWQHRQPGADLGKAKRLYEDVVRELGETPAAPLALMALARMADAPEYEKDRNRKRARELYREIIDRYRGHFLAEEAVPRLAMTYLEELGKVEVENVGVKLACATTWGWRSCWRRWGGPSFT